jgi:hypothetical protein
MPKYFVWITGLRGPEAQLWAEKQVDGSGKAKETLFIRELTADERGLGLDALAAANPRISASESNEAKP